MPDTLRNTTQACTPDGAGPCRPFRPVAVAVHLGGADGGAHDGADLVIRTDETDITIRLADDILVALAETRAAARKAPGRWASHRFPDTTPKDQAAPAPNTLQPQRPPTTS